MPENPYQAFLVDFPPVSTEAWEEKIARDLKGAERDKKLVWHPPEGFAVEPYYRAEDLDALASALTARYTKATDNAWVLRQDFSSSDLDEVIRQAKDARDGGAEALGFVTEVRDDGLYGVPLRNQAALARLLDALPLGDVDLYLDAGPASPALLAMLLNEAERRNFGLETLRGAAKNDPIGALARTGKLHLDAHLALTTDLLNALEGNAFRALAVDLEPYHEAGASAVQELACGLAAASEYLARLPESGVPVARVLEHLHFVVPVGSSYFMEMAKLRALRLLFAQMAAAYAPEDEEPATAPIHAVTSRWNTTVYSPDLNALRATTEAAAALLGGCDVLVVRPYDEAFRTPSDFGLRIARSTQLILRHEAHFGEVADPAGGAYYVEVLTEKLAMAAWALFQQIEAQGGLLAALKAGFVQQEIAPVREKRQHDVATRRRVFVGTNQYPNPTETRLDDVSAPASSASLDERQLPFTFDHEKPLASIGAALKRGATVGDVLRALEAEDEVTMEPLPAERGAALFEEIRLRTERYAEAQGRRPAVFLLPFGPPAMRTARATFARNFFGCAGFAIYDNIGFETVGEGVTKALESRAELVVLCSADEAYAAAAPEAARLLRAADFAGPLVIAGHPQDQIEALRAAGIDGYVHLRAPLLETLRAYQEKLGIV